MKNKTVKPYMAWDEFKDKHYTDEEIVISDLQAEMINELVKARKKLGLSQKQLEELCGVKQPMQARIENYDSIPRIDTLLRLLVPLGYTLKVVQIEKKN